MIVARIAYDRLTARARSQADVLIAAPPSPAPRFRDDFVDAACWMDDLPALGVTQYAAWHFFPLDPGRRSSSRPETSLAVPHLAWAIEQCSETVRREGPAAERSRRLRFLIHLVGDAHQPMHCIESYRSGLAFPVSGIPETHNLRGFWNRAYRLWTDRAGRVHSEPPVQRPTARTEGDKRIRQYAKNLTRHYPRERLQKEAASSNPWEWVSESHTLARTLGLTAPRDATPSPSYVEEAAETARRRIAIAGYRLADLLNEALDDARQRWR